MIKLLGGILMAIGVLIAGASGLCSITIFVMSIGNSGASGTIPLILLFGGIPFVIGAGLILAGRSVIRSADRNG